MSRKRILKEELTNDLLNAPVIEIHKFLTGKHIVQWAKCYLGKTKYERVFGKIDKQSVFESVEKAVHWIVNDRISEGIGKGGWGKSERAWMTHVFGQEAGSRTREAIFSTVAAVEALKAHTKLLQHYNRQNTCYRWDDIESNLMGFLIDDGRYNQISGLAGKLGVDGSDGGRTANLDYRHTAIVLRLWHLQSKWEDYFQLTGRALIDHFGKKEFVDWRSERVVTLVMAYKALVILKASGYLQLTADIENKLKRITGHVVGKFDEDLAGWPAKPEDVTFSSEQKVESRNYYTLLTLAMMPEEWDVGNEELKNQMAQSLHATIDRYLRSEPDRKSFYICRPNDDLPDLCATLIAFSAFARKPKLNKTESAICQGIARYVLNRISKADFDYSDPYDRPYSWIMPYFVLDACELSLETT